VEELGDELGVAVRVHVVTVGDGPNLEARAREARRSVLPPGAMTAHTMDDLAETVLVNLLRGSGVDGLSPMVGDPTKPLLELRREELRGWVETSGHRVIHDPSNDDRRFVRNRLRHDGLPYLSELAGRDLAPILARQAYLLADERAWLDDLVTPDAARGLSEIDCRELRQWPVARLRRWLRTVLRATSQFPPPSADEVERVIAVVYDRAVATEIAGGRRVARHDRHLEVTER
jgi:tRNA(Ile)-lysidine synthase